MKCDTVLESCCHEEVISISDFLSVWLSDVVMENLVLFDDSAKFK